MIVGVENIAFCVETDAAGGANAGAGGDHFSIRRYTDSPTAPVRSRAGGASEAESDPDVAVFVWGSAEGVFVVIAIDAPVGVDGLEDIGGAIAIGVLEAGEFRTLGEVERFIFPIHAEWLVETLGEACPFHL